MGPPKAEPDILLFRFLVRESSPGIPWSCFGIELDFDSGGPSSEVFLPRCLIPNITLNRLLVPPLVARVDRVERIERRSVSIPFSGDPMRLCWLACGLVKTLGDLLLTDAGEVGPYSTPACD